MIVHVGFTGTREGMTDWQEVSLVELLLTLDGEVFHHGDCVGADEQADQIARAAGYLTVIHPPLNYMVRAWCGDTAMEVLPEKDYMARNHDIVDESDVLIAAPKEVEEVMRSGTWATVRYARKKGKQVFILRPER